MELLEEGERVVDLGSGSGMDVFYAATQVGTSGHVTGVDFTPEQLAVTHDGMFRVVNGSGTGVIVSRDGLVLTAGHVCGAPGRELH